MKKTLLTLSLASILIGGVAMAGSEDPATSSGGHSVLYATGASLSAASTTLQQNGVFSFGFHTKKEAQKAARVLGLSDYAIQKKSDTDYKLILDAPAPDNHCSKAPNGKGICE